MRQRVIRWISGLTVVVVSIVCGVATLAASQQGASNPFVPSKGAEEVLPATPLVFAAYALVWVILLAYVFVLWQRLGRVERELADVSARIQSARK